MAYKYFKTFCTLRVLGIFICTGVFFYLLFNKIYYPLIIIDGVLITFQTFSLIRFIEKTNRDLARFLDAIRYEDFSLSFKQNGQHSSFTALAKAFSGIMDEMAEYRSKTEEHYQYLQTVVQHIGISMISFVQDGKVGFINSAALKLFKIDRLNNIHELNKIDPLLSETFINLKNGLHILVPLKIGSKDLLLSINTTKFLMRGQKFTLVSIQDIRNQLEQERAAKELEVAHQVQTGLLPKSLPDIPNVDIAGFCKPAREVGGDFYDFISISPDLLGIVIADVSGKGLPAAIYMTLTKGIVQSKAEEILSPKSVLIKVNRLLHRSLWRDSFVTMFYGILNCKTGKFTYARAGHNPPILISGKNRTASLLESKGIALGISEDKIFSKTINEKVHNFKKGDLLVLYTDGYTEAMDKDRNLFGEERLVKLIASHQGKTCDTLIADVNKEITAFTGDRAAHDDMTMVSVKIK